MSIFGIGPLLLATGAAVIIAGLWLTNWHMRSYNFLPDSQLFTIIGIIWLIIGLYFWLASVFKIMGFVSQGMLITTGVFSLTRNPMYCAFLIFIVPSLSLLLNAWIFLLSSAVMILVFHFAIAKEERMLEGLFGDEYRKYKAATPRLFPKFR